MNDTISIHDYIRAHTFGERAKDMDASAMGRSWVRQRSWTERLG